MHRTLALLQCFADSPQDLAASDLARRTGLALSTAHRLLKVLTTEAFLEQDPGTARYRLGPSSPNSAASPTTVAACTAPNPNSPTWRPAPAPPPTSPPAWPTTPSSSSAAPWTATAPAACAAPALHRPRQGPARLGRRRPIWPPCRSNP
ncbi:helix-turn-helix domain-containing protein [Catenulispora yoronensis]